MAMMTGIFITSIKLEANTLFANKIQQVNIDVPAMTYLYVSYITDTNLNILSQNFWLNVTTKMIYLIYHFILLKYRIYLLITIFLITKI